MSKYMNKRQADARKLTLATKLVALDKTLVRKGWNTADEVPSLSDYLELDYPLLCMTYSANKDLESMRF